VKSPDRAIPILDRTPDVLRAMLAGLGEEYTHANYGPGTFSPFDVVGHLIHADRTNWIPRIRFVLERGESAPFEAFDRYAHVEASRGKSMGALLDEFASVRSGSIGALRRLGMSEERCAALGTHPEIGRVSVGNLLAAWVVHDLHHTAQVCKAMSRQRAEDVGPFRTFLGILNDPKPS